MTTVSIGELRDEFRVAFQQYLQEGERMAALLRTAGDRTPEHVSELRKQQTALNSALRSYEAARRRYVEAVMGQMTGATAMGLPIQ